MHAQLFTVKMMFSPIEHLIKIEKKMQLAFVLNMHVMTKKQTT